MIRIFPKSVLAMALVGAFHFAGAEDSAWVSIMPQAGLKDWTGYFQKGPGNPDSTWQVNADGQLFVNIHLPFAQTGYGHLFYTKKKLSYYMVRAEYKFTMDGYGYADWAQGWNRQNNGLMLHSQDPSTMNGKDFPTCIEVQLLGPKNEQNPGKKTEGFKYATSANMCSPSTFVAYNGNADYQEHCTAASYPAAWKNTEIPWEDAGGWSDVTVRVLADSLFQHFIHGVKVMEYTKIRTDNGTALKDGYISIQAEGTPTLFKTLQILDLTGCMDNTKPAYRSYFVKNDPQACNSTGALPRTGETGPALAREGSLLSVQGHDASISEVRRADGTLVGIRPGARSFAPDRAGVYLVTIRSADGISVSKAAWY